MDIQQLFLSLPYRVDVNTIAVLNHSIKNGTQKFSQTIYGNRHSIRRGMISIPLTEKMYVLFINRLKFKECIFNPVDLLPEKASLSVNGETLYMYDDPELTTAVERAIDGITFRVGNALIERLSTAGDLDLDSLVSILEVPSILHLIQKEECLNDSHTIRSQ